LVLQATSFLFARHTHISKHERIAVDLYDSSFKYNDNNNNNNGRIFRYLGWSARIIEGYLLLEVFESGCITLSPRVERYEAKSYVCIYQAIGLDPPESTTSAAGRAPQKIANS